MSKMKRKSRIGIYFDRKALLKFILPLAFITAIIGGFLMFGGLHYIKVPLNFNSEPWQGTSETCPDPDLKNR